ncbi:MAG: Hydroxyacid dehydrogenase [Verrucomicrobiaceae bacterium]|nr:Hydroxyacid dehydrogenase [Verrucomicrobiaceae bacterium]
MPPPLLLIAPLPEFLREPLNRQYELLDYHRAPDKEAMLKEHGARIRAIVGVGGSVAQPVLLDQLPALEIISVNGVGYDGVAVDYCEGRGIRVTNTPDVLTDDVADVAVALVLMTGRGLVKANRLLHANKWSEGSSALTTKTTGKKAGIVGLGRIGKAIATRLSAFDMEIGYHGRHPQAVLYTYYAGLEEMAAWCDFLIVVTPGGAGTYHLIDAKVLAALGAKGTLINVARGSVVDETALVQALQQGTIGGAGLDVFEHEPAVPAELLAMEQVVLLPHVGSATQETRAAMAKLVLDNLAAHFAGKPLLTPVV